MVRKTRKTTRYGGRQDVHNHQSFVRTQALDLLSAASASILPAPKIQNPTHEKKKANKYIIVAALYAGDYQRLPTSTLALHFTTQP